MVGQRHFRTEVEKEFFEFLKRSGLDMRPVDIAL